MINISKKVHDNSASDSTTMSELQTKVASQNAALYQLKEATSSFNYNSNDPIIKSKIQNINNELDEIDDIKQQVISQRVPVAKSKFNDNMNFSKKYRKALTDYIRKGIDTDVLRLKAQYLANNCNDNENDCQSSNVFSDDSGVVSMFDAGNQIQAQLSKQSVIRRCGAMQIPTSLPVVRFPIRSGALTCNWSDGNRYVPLSNTNSTTIDISIYDATVSISIPSSLLADSYIDILNILIQLATDEFATLFEDNAFIYGSRSNNQPNGILSNPNIISQTNNNTNNINLQSLISMMSLIRPESQINGQQYFVVSAQAKQQIRTLTNGTMNTFVLNENALSAPMEQIFGIPIITCPAMTAVCGTYDGTNVVNNNNIPVIFGNFNKGYAIIDRSDIVIARDPFTQKPNIIFDIKKRVGGDVIDPQSFVKLVLP